MIEVLVSMVILSVSLTVIMGLFSGGLRSKRMAFEYNMAVAQAENILSQRLIAHPLESGMESGIFENGSRWESEVTYWDEEGGKKENNRSDGALLKITVNIIWVTGGKEKKYTLQTIAQG